MCRASWAVVPRSRVNVSVRGFLDEAGCEVSVKRVAPPDVGGPRPIRGRPECLRGGQDAERWGKPPNTTLSSRLLQGVAPLCHPPKPQVLLHFS